VSEGIDRVLKAIANLTGPLLQKFKQRATYSVAGKIRQQMVVEPPESHSPVVWASEKQRRWYFAQRRAEGLPLKYERKTDPWSQRIQNKWRYTRGSDYTVLGNRADYAAYVQSRDYQSRQHEATGWTTDEQAAEQIISDGTMQRIVDAQVRAIVREAFRGLG